MRDGAVSRAEYAKSAKQHRDARALFKLWEGGSEEEAAAIIRQTMAITNSRSTERPEMLGSRMDILLSRFDQQ